MKLHPLIIAVVCCLIAANEVQAQRNALSAGVIVQGFSNVDPEPTYTGPVLVFENKLSKHFSAQVLGGYFPKEIEFAGVPAYTRRLITVQPEIRFYPGQVFKGFFLGGNLSYHNFKTEAIKGFNFEPAFRKTPTDYFGFGFSLGMQSSISKRFLWSLQAGGNLIPNPGGVGSGARYFIGLTAGHLFN